MKTLRAASITIFSLAITMTGAASATTFFMPETNPGGAKLFLDSAKDGTSSFGSVVSNDDVAISVSGASDFASGFANIKPVKGGALTDLTFRPTNPDEFSDFSFRGQDLAANQTIDVIVTDQNGNVQTIDFTETKANVDFTRIGIVGLAGETIKSVELVDSGGFKEAKQFEFSGANIANNVPEPATWTMMLAGFFGLGGMLRGRREKRLAGTI